jgi:hypothetical protein
MAHDQARELNRFLERTARAALRCLDERIEVERRLRDLYEAIPASDDGDAGMQEMTDDT